MRNFIFQIMVCVVFMGTSFAQNDSVPDPKKINYDQQSIDPIQFDEETIASHKKEEAFNYEEIHQDNWWTQFKAWAAKIWSRFWSWLLGSYDATGIMAFLIRILPYLFLAALLGFIVWLFIRLNPAAGVLTDKEHGSVLLSEDEKIIQHADISELIQQAKRDRNFRLAVRYYYLLILKKMRDLDLIDYQFQKTNEEYLKELTGLPLKQKFQNITHSYDFIWYGDFPVTENDFIKVEKDFTTLQNALNSGSHGETL